jgi:hypothetical protein
MRSVLLAAMTAVLLQGCASEGTAPGGADAQLRLASASSDAGALDLLLNGRTIARAVTHSDASAATRVPPGQAMAEIRATGSSAALLSLPVSLQAGESYTLVVAGPHRALTAVVSVDTGSSGPPTSPPPVSGEPPDSGTPLPDPGVARFRIVHAAPHAPPLDPYLTPVGAELDTIPLFEPFEYGSLALISDAVRRPGEYAVQFTEKGTKRVVLESGAIDAAAGELLTVVLGEEADRSLRVDVVRE